MSTQTQATLSRADIKVLPDLDLGINALNTPVVRSPWVGGPVGLRATKVVLNAVRSPWVGGAVNLRATKTILTVG